MIYENRADAGKRLARELAAYKGQDPLVLALPRGGLPVAAEVALSLDAPLDLIFVRKLGVPMEPELAMGAVIDGDEPYVVRNEDVLSLLPMAEEEFRRICEQELAEIERRRVLYLKDRARADPKDRVVIPFDTGTPTGATPPAACEPLS